MKKNDFEIKLSNMLKKEFEKRKYVVSIKNERKRKDNLSICIGSKEFCILKKSDVAIIHQDNEQKENPRREYSKLKKSLVITTTKKLQYELAKRNIFSEQLYVSEDSFKIKTRGKKEKYFVLEGAREENKKETEQIIQAFRKEKEKLIIIKRKKTNWKEKNNQKKNKSVEWLLKGEKNIFFKGINTKEEQTKLYKEAKAIIILPNNNEEQISIKSMEMGKTVITFIQAKFLSELIKNLHNGIVTKPKKESIKKVLQYIRKNPKEIYQINKNAKEQTKNMTIESFKKEVMHFIEKKSLIRKSYSKEENLLLHILQDTKIRSTGIDWKKFIELVRYHQLQNIVLKKSNEIPPKVKYELTLQNFINKKKNQESIKRFLFIKKIFEENNISFEAIKGIKNLLKGEIDRPTADIDILIKKRDLLKALQLLNKEGFAYINDKIHEAHYKEYFISSKNPKKIWRTTIELKTKIDQHLPLQYEDLIKNRYHDEILFCFDAHHSLIDHAFHNLKWMCEAKEKLEKKELDIKRILSTAKKLKMRKIVRIYILIIKKLFKANIAIKSSYDEEKIIEKLFKEHNFISKENKKQYELSCFAKVILAENKKLQFKEYLKAFFPRKAELEKDEQKKRWFIYKTLLHNKELREILKKALKT